MAFQQRYEGSEDTSLVGNWGKNGAEKGHTTCKCPEANTYLTWSKNCGQCGRDNRIKGKGIRGGGVSEYQGTQSYMGKIRNHLIIRHL